MKIPSNIITLILGVLVTLISLWYGQNHGLMPVAASTDASEVDGIFNFMMTIATGLFLIVEGVLVYSILRFRRKPGDRSDGPLLKGNVPLEIFWTAIPTVIVLVLSVYSFEVYNNLGGLDPVISREEGAPPPLTAPAATTAEATIDGSLDASLDSPVVSRPAIAMVSHHTHLALGIGPDYGTRGGTPPLEVNVKGIQYAWIFTYPETGIVSGELHVPVDRPVKINMEAGDVIHAFWVPQLRLKQDVIPGRETTLAFTSNREGTYPIVCAELCGSYHGGMKSTMVVHSQADYDRWVQENTLAQTENGDRQVAFNPSDLSDGDYLAPYAREMGIDADALGQLHALHSHRS